ncbi:hypothetical protein DUNSADRAFT_8999 [Dunaliella salina]|uniref:Encoded protein n=1 Tax=Dunaliella salina TaxID=3046 RepID=A0ABQ7GID6_DUNSA|nr:hypothetical protein DUNSADRAFT_8999 [Dunaliella salina]|eukprot:KAF5834376.1 hypothetical protein DUNSADRAFT_8999 [Dunaliella salina]
MDSGREEGSAKFPLTQRPPKIKFPNFNEKLGGLRAAVPCALRLACSANVHCRCEQHIVFQTNRPTCRSLVLIRDLLRRKGRGKALIQQHSFLASHS